MMDDRIYNYLVELLAMKNKILDQTKQSGKQLQLIIKILIIKFQINKKISVCCS